MKYIKIFMIFIEMLLVSFVPSLEAKKEKVMVVQNETTKFSSWYYCKISNIVFSLDNKLDDYNFNFDVSVSKLNMVGTFYVFAYAENENGKTKSNVETINAEVGANVVNIYNLYFPWTALSKTTKITVYASRNQNVLSAADKIYFNVTSKEVEEVDSRFKFYYGVKFIDENLINYYETINFNDYKDVIEFDDYFRFKIENYHIYFNTSSLNPVNIKNVKLFFKDPLNRYSNLFSLYKDTSYRYIPIYVKYAENVGDLFFNFTYGYYVNPSTLYMYKYKIDNSIPNKGYFYLPLFDYEDYKEMDFIIYFSEFGIIKKPIYYRFKMSFINETAYDHFYVISETGKRDWGEKMEEILI